MCQTEIGIWPLLLVLGPSLFAVGGAWWNLRTEIKANRKASTELFNLQKREQDVRANIPAVLEILEDLADLQQAFIFRGQFIPGLEHRCPNIQFEDGETEDQMSVAERTHQIRLIACRIIRNCRKVVFLTPKDFMPKTVDICKRISNALGSKNPGQNRLFEIKIGNIATILQTQCDRQGISLLEREQLEKAWKEACTAAEKACDVFVAELEEYQVELEAQVIVEFPTFAKRETFSS